MIKGEWVEQDWLTAIGVVQETLRDRQEIVLTVLKGTDGSFFDSVISKVQKQNGETRLIYREPLVILERLKGKKTPHQRFKKETLTCLSNISWNDSACSCTNKCRCRRLSAIIQDQVIKTVKYDKIIEIKGTGAECSQSRTIKK